MDRDLRYPLGRFEMQHQVPEEDISRLLDQLAVAPARLRIAVEGLVEEQLDTPYRPGGWTVRQVVHHLPDSHLNAYVRFRLALTENEPTVKGYRENLWAELSDARTAPVDVSLGLLDSLHGRLVALLRSLDLKEWGRTLIHPELGALRLDQHLSMYAWHGRHHVAQIAGLRERMDW